MNDFWDRTKYPHIKHKEQTWQKIARAINDIDEVKQNEYPTKVQEYSLSTTCEEPTIVIVLNSRGYMTSSWYLKLPGFQILGCGYG